LDDTLQIGMKIPKIQQDPELFDDSIPTKQITQFFDPPYSAKGDSDALEILSGAHNADQPNKRSASLMYDIVLELCHISSVIAIST